MKTRIHSAISNAYDTVSPADREGIRSFVEDLAGRDIHSLLTKKSITTIADFMYLNNQDAILDYLYSFKLFLKLEDINIEEEIMDTYIGILNDIDILDPELIHLIKPGEVYGKDKIVALILLLRLFIKYTLVIIKHGEDNE